MASSTSSTLLGLGPAGSQPVCWREAGLRWTTEEVSRLFPFLLLLGPWLLLMQTVQEAGAVGLFPTEALGFLQSKAQFPRK